MAPHVRDIRGPMVQLVRQDMARHLIRLKRQAIPPGSSEVSCHTHLLRSTWETIYGPLTNVPADLEEGKDYLLMLKATYALVPEAERRDDAPVVRGLTCWQLLRRSGMKFTALSAVAAQKFGDDPRPDLLPVPAEPVS